MTGLLTAAGIADNYGLVLFVHFSALLGAISAGRSPTTPKRVSAPRRPSPASARRSASSPR